jgi:hypothetical protein
VRYVRCGGDSAAAAGSGGAGSGNGAGGGGGGDGAEESCILYPAAVLGVLYSPRNHRQRYYHGQRGG